MKLNREDYRTAIPQLERKIKELESAGVKGETSYFHIMYSAVPAPSEGQMTKIPDVYIGTYTDFNPIDSEDPSRYVWARFRGQTGREGDDGHSPYVNATTNTWWEWNDGAYQDTGITPKGDKGDPGQDADIWTIGSDGYWYKNGVKQSIKARGSDADVWTIGADNYWYLNGVKTDKKAQGDKGDAGYTPTIDTGTAEDGSTTLIVTNEGGTTTTPLQDGLARNDIITLEGLVNNSSVENLPSYISIDTSTDGSNVQLLVIGTGAFHTVVSATGLRFYMNESKANILADNWGVNSESDMAVAYLTNNKLKINRAVIVEGMEIGDAANGSFEWRKRYVPANGGNNFYLKWLG